MLKSKYECEACAELSIDSNGWNFLVIFGKHINGYYIAIPNHNICVEAACAADTFYNEGRLLAAGIGVCPSDAAEEARQAADVISSRPGGKGVVREYMEKVMKERGDWEFEVALYKKMF